MVHVGWGLCIGCRLKAWRTQKSPGCPIPAQSQMPTGYKKLRNRHEFVISSTPLKWRKKNCSIIQNKIHWLEIWALHVQTAHASGPLATLCEFKQLLKSNMTLSKKWRPAHCTYSHRCRWQIASVLITVKFSDHQRAEFLFSGLQTAVGIQSTMSLNTIFNKDIFCNILSIIIYHKHSFLAKWPYETS